MPDTTSPQSLHTRSTPWQIAGKEHETTSKVGTGDPRVDIHAYEESRREAESQSPRARSSEKFASNGWNESGLNSLQSLQRKRLAASAEEATTRSHFDFFTNAQEDEIFYDAESYQSWSASHVASESASSASSGVTSPEKSLIGDVDKEEYEAMLRDGMPQLEAEAPPDDRQGSLPEQLPRSSQTGQSGETASTAFPPSKRSKDRMSPAFQERVFKSYQAHLKQQRRDLRHGILPPPLRSTLPAIKETALEGELVTRLEAGLSRVGEANRFREKQQFVAEALDMASRLRQETSAYASRAEARSERNEAEE